MKLFSNTRRARTASLLGLATVGALTASFSPKFVDSTVRLAPVVVESPKVPLEDSVLQARILAESKLERDIVRNERSAQYLAMKDAFLNRSRNETAFYDANTGEFLHSIKRLPNINYDIAVPDTTVGCKMMGVQTPPAIKRQISSLENSLGPNVISFTGRRSDIDCAIARSGDLLQLFAEIFRSQGIVPNLGFYVQESGGNGEATSRVTVVRNNVARVVPIAQGAWQFKIVYNNRFADTLRARGIHFSSNNQVLQAWMAANAVKAEQMFTGSELLAKVRYHTGPNGELAKADGEHVYELAGIDPGEPRSLRNFLLGSEVAFNFWSSLTPRDRLKITQFGPASSRYFIEDLVYTEIIDSVISSQPRREYHAYLSNTAFDLPSLSTELGIPVDSLLPYNPHMKKGGRFVRQPKNSLIVAVQELDLPSLRPFNFWRANSSELALCFDYQNKLPPAPIDSVTGSYLSRCFMDAGNLGAGFIFSTNFGRIGPSELDAITDYLENSRRVRHVQQEAENRFGLRSAEVLTK